MQVDAVVHARFAWKGQLTGPTMAPFRVLSIDPEPAYPLGRRGLVMASAWEQLREARSAGMITWDGDVAADPCDVQAMFGHVASEPEAVWTAPLRLWPRSTHLPAWVWGHRKSAPGSMPVSGKMKLWQDDRDDVDVFSFGFTWLPAALMDASCEAGLDSWRFPHVDVKMREVAVRLGIPVRVARDCRPVHLNF